MIFKKTSNRKLFLFVGDIFIIIFSTNLAFIIRLEKSIMSYLSLYDGIIITLLMLISCLISFYIFDLYNIKAKIKTTQIIGLTLGSLILVTLFIVIFFYLFPYILGRGIFVISLSLIGILIIIWRMLYSIIFRLTLPQRNILIVGSRRKAEPVYSLIKNNPDYKVIGLIDNNMKKIEFSKREALEDSPSLEEVVKNQKIDDIIVTIDTTKKRELHKALVNSKMKGINIYDIPAFYEDVFYKLPVSYIKPNWLLYSDGFSKLSSKVYKRLKRMIDLTISSTLLLLSFPIGIITFLALKLSSKGPIFFTQERVGENQKPFKLFKLRTMVSDAEEGEPAWAAENDPRVTLVGKILRKIRLDELPQLINILKGEMSLIGPRPEREFFIKKFNENIPYYSLRFSVKPGLTGWAQVMYRYGASEEDALEKLQYELYYVKNMSLPLDFRILLKTIRIVLFGQGR